MILWRRQWNIRTCLRIETSAPATTMISPAVIENTVKSPVSLLTVPCRDRSDPDKTALTFFHFPGGGSRGSCLLHDSGTCLTPLRMIQVKNGSRPGLLLGGAVERPEPFDHCTCVYPGHGPIRKEILEDTKCLFVMGIIKYRDDHYGISDIKVRVARGNLSSPLVIGAGIGSFTIVNGLFS